MSSPIIRPHHYFTWCIETWAVLVSVHTIILFDVLKHELSYYPSTSFFHYIIETFKVRFDMNKCFGICGNRSMILYREDYFLAKFESLYSLSTGLYHICHTNVDCSFIVALFLFVVFNLLTHQTWLKLSNVQVKGR